MSDQIRKKRIYYINSENYLSSTNSTFNVALQIPDYIAYNRIALLQASIPISYYLIQYGFNTFTLKEDNTSVLISIPIGNYNINSFALIITSLLTANSPNNLTYTLTYNNSYIQVTNGLYTFTVNSIAHTVSFIFGDNSVNEQFGFNTGSTDTFTAGSTTSTLVSTNVTQFVPENTVYIHSNIVDSGSSDILQEMYNANNPAFSYISWTNPDPLAYSKLLASNKVQNVSFSFTNEHNTPIYFNGVNISLTIMLYRDNDYYEKSENFMKYQMLKEKHMNEA